MKSETNDMVSPLRHAINNLKEGNNSQAIKWLDIALDEISKLRQRIIELDEKEKS